MNNVKIEIQKDGVWVDYTKRAYNPYKYGDFLDERLEEGLIALKRTTDEYFQPLTLIRLTVENFPECKLSAQKIAEIQARANDNHITYETVGSRLKETRQKYFFIASDSAFEMPIGSGKYSHEIYIIELTKIAEGYIGDSITFTNALGSVYTES